jgi:hypothetical protein
MFHWRFRRLQSSSLSASDLRESGSVQWEVKDTVFSSLIFNCCKIANSLVELGGSGNTHWPEVAS